jgi:L-lactate utilization protein LutC
MSSKDDILNRLRGTLNQPSLRFPSANPQPLTAEERMTVGIIEESKGDGRALAERFGAELEKLHGTYEIVESPSEARLTLMNRLTNWVAEEQASWKGVRFETGQDRKVLCWSADALPVSGLAETMADMNLEFVSPQELISSEARDAVKYIRYGLTGVEAAFAATGSMLVPSGAQTSRSASLLPFRHIALIPLSRLHPTIEDWMAEQRAAQNLHDLVRAKSNLSLITGPSKSADIEMNLTLGVHGPKFVHAILFGDR